MSNNATDTPYQRASDYLELAQIAASRAQAVEPDGHRWRNALLALAIAQMGLPVPTAAPGHNGRSCLDLAQDAVDSLGRIPSEVRHPDHLVTLAYVQDALRAVEAAAGEITTA
jgi:hypothetical protein